MIVAKNTWLKDKATRKEEKENEEAEMKKAKKKVRV